MAGLWLSPRLESGCDEKPSKNAEISLNLTTQISNLFSRLGLLAVYRPFAYNRIDSWILDLDSQ